MADAKSVAAQRAAEELLPEEERWQRWSFDELKAELDRRGICGGVEREQLLASLLEVKRWEGLAAKDLKAQCQKRGLAVDTNADRDELLTQLKQDFSWENMQEEDLRYEIKSRGIPLPDATEQPAFDRAMRSRLRQAARWEKLPLEQLRRACELRHYDPQGQSREQMLEFLKSFKVLPQPKPPPPPPPAPPTASRPSPPQQQPQYQWDDMDGPSTWGYKVSGSAGFEREKEREPSDDEEGPRLPPGLSDRVKKICRKYPNFTGTYLPEMENWTDQDIEMYLYSNGFLKPNKSKKPTLPKVPRRLHYRTLGLPDGAPPSDVRKAYRRLALIYHPDKNPNDPEGAAENFKSITEAYEALTASFAAEQVAG